MVNILFMIPNLGHGGAEKVLVNLVNHMDQSKFDITVMALYDEGVNKQFLKEGIKYRSCMKRSFPGVAHVLKLFTPERLYKHFVKEQYDIVISYLEGQTARIVSGCTDSNVKKISWIHVEQHTKENAARLFRNIPEMEKSYLKFDQTICVSEYVRNDFCSVVPVRNSRVLYNTIESDKIRELSEEKIDECVFSDKEINVCGVGTLKQSKGFDRLLRIHNRLRQEGYQVHTYILGEGAEKRKLEEYVFKKNLSDSVSFLGYHTNPYKFIKRCDLFVCSSYAEGFSTAATEALIVGTPVCTVDVSGMKEMLGEDNEYGIVTNNDEESFYNALKLLLDNPELLEHYTRQATLRGKIFQTKDTVKEVEKLFIKISERE